MKQFHMMEASQPRFQENGPYHAYTERHEQLRKEQGAYLVLLLLPSALYMFSRNGLFLLIGAVYLLSVLIYLRLKRNRLFQEYTMMEQRTMRRLHTVLTEKGLNGDAPYTFGYLKDSSSFKPVLLMKEGRTLLILDNPFSKNLIYAFESQMVYLLDPDETALAQRPICLAFAELSWAECSSRHLDLLRSEATRLNEYLVIESFIYRELLESMKCGRRKKPLHADYCLSGLKKEPVYETILPDGRTLYLPSSANDILGLVPQNLQRKVSTIERIFKHGRNSTKLRLDQGGEKKPLWQC